ncbi:LamG-like jellyroll fold domain-containing protein [Sinomicrobium soli]|uniref:LamG-like jellyroll fold domain-containing protein n=1 Tax=Sinomicrobium sp. N-1-3-6 TaxID=2219864 RepID=UPI001374F0DE|nr:LamG-like jellyroll fold domain-containing protein [Sinomicrobium sp. N-1-3-6]
MISSAELNAGKISELHRLFNSEKKPEVVALFVEEGYEDVLDKLDRSVLSPLVVRDTSVTDRGPEDDGILVFGDGDEALFNTGKWIADFTPYGVETGKKNNKAIFTRIDARTAAKAIRAKDIVDVMLNEKGKFPNFITTDQAEEWNKIADSLSGLKFYHANVLFEGENLSGVRWSQQGSLISDGPIVTTAVKISPKKRGFWFSPDIFSFSDAAGPPGIKIFKAYQYDLKEALRYYLPLRSKEPNNVLPYDNGIYTDVSFAEDETRGRVALFNGKTSYIDFRNTDDVHFGEVTVSVWVKPDEISGSHSLIGKGEAFSAKIYKGKMQFTTPGLKDHDTGEIVVRAGEWTHLTYVYSIDRKVYFYVNGKLVDETVGSALEQTRHSLLVGTNLWGQYYKGKMSQLSVWNRALSDEEVSRVYVIGVPSSGRNTGNRYWIVGGIILLLLSATAIVVYRVRSGKVRKPGEVALKVAEFSPPDKTADEPAVALPPGGGSVLLLDEFRITGKAGEDITFRFSPKRRELFLLLLFYTLKEGGISSRKMGNLLWPGFSPESVKNNRSTHIKEIRKAVENHLDIRVIHENKIWYLQPGDEVYIDLWEIERKIPVFSGGGKALPSRETLLEWTALISRGGLLPQTESEWIDRFKADYANAVLDVLVPVLEDEEYTDSEILEVINGILTIDPLFEPAVKKKISILMKAGKHTLARKAVENYKKLYESFYGEVYEADFPV